ncbi:hypothetical protein ACF0H5_012847 [Mactra antiquata]
MKGGQVWMLICAILVSILDHVMSKMDDNAVVDATFNVIPGGQTLSHTEKWGDLTCEFTYTCQGGTKEEWTMSITRDNEGNYLCRVERHDEVSSYLFFQTFELKVGGGKILDGIIYGKDHQSVGADKEFIVHRSKNALSNSDHFESKLHKVIVIFNKKGHVEL